VQEPPPKAITVAPTDKPPPKQDFAPSPQQTAPVAAPPTTAPTAVAGSCKHPEYPAISDRLNEEGTVVLKMNVGVDGSVKATEVASSSGFKRLDDAAVAALSLCKFKPATTNGQPSEGVATVRYRFTH
jgi:protein TonB